MAAADQQTVAVIIPAYNAASFISRSVKSALAQDEVVEVVVVDDASPDNTGEVVAELARHDDRVRLIRLETNGGPAAARNAGISASKSDWVATLDADDAYEPGRFGPLLRLAERHDADLVSDNLAYFDISSSKVLGPSVHPEPKEQEVTLTELFRSTPAGGKDYITLMPIYRRSFLEENGIVYKEDIRNGEDFDFIAQCLAAGARYVTDLHRQTYLYTTRDSGISQTVLTNEPVIRQAKTWLGHPAFRGRPERIRLVRERISILRRRQLDRMAGQAGLLRKLSILLLAVRTPGGRRWLRDWVSAKLDSRAGEPAYQ